MALEIHFQFVHKTCTSVNGFISSVPEFHRNSAELAKGSLTKEFLFGCMEIGII